MTFPAAAERNAQQQVVILGGGVTGLSCAHALGPLVRSGRLRVTLLESRDRLGGNIQTDRVDDFVIDAGPDAWVVNKPDATSLAKELGLEQELVSTIEANRRVYIAHEGKLHPMPEGLVLGIPTELAPFIATSLLTFEGKLRAGFDLFIPPRRFSGNEDESVGHFVSRRLGEEVSDRLVGPLLGGIFAGDAYTISVRAAFPSLVEAEKKHGSLILAMRALRAERSASGAGAGAGAGKRPVPSAFVALRGGMSRLIDALETTVRVHTEIRMRVAATAIRRCAGRFAVTLANGEVLVADHVVMAMPTRASAEIARELDGAVAQSLDGLLGYSSTAAVFLAFPRDAVDDDLRATGFIVPHSPGRTLVATTFVTSKWEDRGPPGQVLFRAFLGGDAIDDLLEREDDELVRIAREELGAFVPLAGEPTLARVYRHRLASPQPHVGHYARRAKLLAELARFPGLYVAAGAVDGVGIPDCVRQARAVAAQIAAAATSGE